MSILSNFELAKFFLVPEKFYLLFNILVLVLLFVVLLLKGLALWRSARLNQRIWFWIFIFVNTIGILEIVYLLIYKDGFNQLNNKASKGSLSDKNQENKGEKKRFSLRRKEKKENQPIEKKEEKLDLAEAQNLDMNNWVS